jgi:hypothetical protein
MQIVALDGTKLIVLMLAGGTFALAGLWLMFRPQPAGEAARIELFGLKFQASSAGRLVFLIGAAFLAVPIFVPEKPSPLRTAAGAPASGASSTEIIALGNGREDATPTGEGLASTEIRSEIAENGIEVEPNDRFTIANSIELGTSVTGSLSGQDMDTFAVAMLPDMKGRIAASLIVTKGDVVLTLFNDAGQVVGSDPTYFPHENTASVAGPIDSQMYFVVIGNKGDDDSAYYLTVGIRPD